MSGGDIQQGTPPPPPPRPPTGSPFGRFMTAPVLVVALVALAVSFATLSGSGGDGEGNSGSGGPAEQQAWQLAGTWAGRVSRVGPGRRVAVRLELDDDGLGAMRRGRCAGTLAPIEVQDYEATYEYAETSGRRGCPRLTEVSVVLDNRGRLRLEERRPDGGPLASGTLRRR